MLQNEWLSFYRDEGATLGGYGFGQVMNFTLQELEETHDYIQWLFPNFEESDFNLNVPLLTEDLIATIQDDPYIKLNIQSAVSTMLRFWGIKYSFSEVMATPDFEERKKVWCCDYNHNQLRITRMIIFLKAIGQETLVEGLISFLESHMSWADLDESKALKFWKEAAL